MTKYKKIWILFLAILPLSVLAADFNADLFYGMKNKNEVLRLQEFLRDQGVYSGPVTGNFLNLTREGIKNFQKREKITPVSGYFGPKSRARANAILQKQTSAAASPLTPAPAAQATTSVSTTTAAQATTTAASAAPVIQAPPPAFVKLPRVSQSSLFKNIVPPLGAHYGYRVKFDWAGDGTEVKQSITCSPALQYSQNWQATSTEYYPEPNTSYTCGVTLENQNGSATSSSFGFASPSWLGISGTSNFAFPGAVQPSLKIGDLTFYNGTGSAFAISQIVLDVSDSMNSPNNRGRLVYFILRNGTTTASDEISRSNFTFNSQPPIYGPNNSILYISYPTVLAVGETRTVSLWVDNLDLVLGGTLRFVLNNLQANSSFNLGGGLNFLLTK